MIKFIARSALVSLLVLVALSIWHVTTASAREQAKRCDIYETKDGVQVIECSTRTAEQAKRCRILTIGGEHSVVCPK